jgi:choloylglycine hydrolase
MHLAISDPTGDSAIFEYVNGGLVIHHGKQYKVLTNSPTYDQQLAIMEYWKDAGGLSKSLPRASRAADRFIRATFLAGAIPAEESAKHISGSPQQKFQYQAAMSVLSVMRSVRTPMGYSLDDQPWVSSTIWRTVSDSTNRVVMFDSAMTPATFWVRLDDLDLRPGAPVKKLELVGGRTYSGNATDKFVEAKCSSSRTSGICTNLRISNSTCNRSLFACAGGDLRLSPRRGNFEAGQLKGGAVERPPFTGERTAGVLSR